MVQYENTNQLDTGFYQSRNRNMESNLEELVLLSM